MLNKEIVFSVDFEDWYQGIEIPPKNWTKYQSRIEFAGNKLLDLLDENEVKGTFFILGDLASKNKRIVNEIYNRGHEIASHGFSHEKVYNLSKEEFREEVYTTKNILEDLTGTKVLAFRAPYFSVISSNLWALEVLKEVGYEVDCSISPIKTWRYGIESCPDNIFFIEDIGITEFPVSKIKVFNKNLALGGAFFRILPYFLTERGVEKRLKDKKETMFYIHPWEYDPGHPKVKLNWKAFLTHYYGLNNTYNYTEKLLETFSFNTLSKVLDQASKNKKIQNVNSQILLSSR